MTFSGKIVGNFVVVGGAVGKAVALLQPPQPPRKVAPATVNAITSLVPVDAEGWQVNDRGLPVVNVSATQDDDDIPVHRPKPEGPPPRGAGGSSMWVPPADKKGAKFKVIRSYEPQMDDELKLTRGFTFVVEEAFDDG